ncbi:hypothetical protein [Alistipes putredinis]|uniref:hypothetical protein n=1 Tax=Alistipes putredinis TaxID=28117 RepID=UPI0039843D6A
MWFSTSCRRSSWSWSSKRMALMVIFCDAILRWAMSVSSNAPPLSAWTERR